MPLGTPDLLGDPGGMLNPGMTQAVQGLGCS